MPGGPPAADVAPQWQLLTARPGHGVDEAQLVQSGDLRPPPVCHPGVELVQPAVVGVKGGIG